MRDSQMPIPPEPRERSNSSAGGDWLPGFIILLLLLLGLGYAYHKFFRPEPVTPVQPADTKRQSVITGRAKQNEQLAVDTLQYLAANKALQERLTRSMLNGKQQDLIIAQLKARYRKTPTIAGCDTLVQEQGSRIDSLKSEVATHRKDSLNKEMLLKQFAGHVKDRNFRIDTLDAIAKYALKPRLKVFATAAFEKQPLSNNIKVGGTGTYDKWLFGYEAGILQPTHEIKAGVLIRLKR